MSKVKIAVLESQVKRLLEKQKELTERVRANEKVVAAIGLLGSVVVGILGTGIFQKAEACSYLLDSSEFTCPSHDGVVDDIFEKSSFEDNISKKEPRYIKDFQNGKLVYLDTRDNNPLVILDTYNHMVDSIRNWKLEKKRELNPIEEMLNNTLMEYEDGSNGSTESEELLQLPSNED